MTDQLRGNDPGRWGHSLANLAEILIPLLDAVEARSVVEIGAYAGDLTGELLTWADRTGARVIAVDPSPQRELTELAGRDERLELVHARSQEALPGLPAVDAVIVDGDHNYYTVSDELRTIGERLLGPDGPLILLHDVCWPHARRDSYYAPARIPEEARQPMVEGGGLVPGDPGIVEGGLPYRRVAQREGGPRNGVLTAVEDFVRDRPEMRLASVPAFFGLAVLWPTNAPWSDVVARIIDPWDGNAVVARLEANRIHHLVRQYSQRPELERLRARNQQMSDLIRGLMSSRAFKFAERLSRLRNPRRPSVWREDARRLLDEERDG
jgi:SAM-dependent methyltransferase